MADIMEWGRVNTDLRSFGRARGRTAKGPYSPGESDSRALWWSRYSTEECWTSRRRG